MNNLVRAEPRKVNKAVCPIHGDIGIINPVAWVDLSNSAKMLYFTLDGGNDMLCLRCVRDLLLKQLKPIKVIEKEIY